MDKGSTVTVTSVRKDPDGSYDVFATKADTKVKFDVRADLATITEGKAERGGADRKPRSRGSLGSRRPQPTILLGCLITRNRTPAAADRVPCS